jgi:hypothetical protein
MDDGHRRWGDRGDGRGNVDTTECHDVDVVDVSDVPLVQYPVCQPPSFDRHHRHTRLSLLLVVPTLVLMIGGIGPSPLETAAEPMPCFDVPHCSPYYIWLGSNIFAVWIVPCAMNRSIPLLLSLPPSLPPFSLNLAGISQSLSFLSLTLCPQPTEGSQSGARLEHATVWQRTYVHGRHVRL